MNWQHDTEDPFFMLAERRFDNVMFIFLKVVRLCREHGLYGALIYLFNQGLNDYRAPLEELLSVVQSSPRKEASRTCYRMLVYLKYCFQGLAFPPGFNITGFLMKSHPLSVCFFFFLMFQISIV